MTLLDLLFPVLCVGCNRLGSTICETCRLKLRPVVIDRCLYCKRPSLYGLTHVSCRRTNGVDGVVVFFYYQTVMRAIIRTVKYQSATSVLKEFFLVLRPQGMQKISFFKRFPDSFVLQPIPLHAHKMRVRGFNQSRLIAEYIHNFTYYPLIEALMRDRDTKSQATLSSRKERFLNTKNAFTLTKWFQPLKDSTFILVDDVITSGSTVKAACSTLKRAGVKRVYVVALALG